MTFSKLVEFIKRFDVLLITIVILAAIIYFIRDIRVDPDSAIGYGLMVYMYIWSVFAFVCWMNGKRWNY